MRAFVVSPRQDLPAAPFAAPLGLPQAERGSGGPVGAASVPLTFDQVYAEYCHRVSRWARALGGLEADLDDLTQDVFLVVRRRLGDFDGRNLSPWLYGITRKTVSDYRRKAWFKRTLSGVMRSLHHTPAAERVAAEDPYVPLEARRMLWQVLDRISPLRRSAFVLFEIEGYSAQEIAELEQIPTATVYTRLHHARKDFLRLLADLTGEPSEEPPL